ncbi:MAG: transcriptional regulator [Saprospiraceae bacterium]|nr:transcriptional regulator [Saprospiraceae bacterium]
METYHLEQDWKVLCITADSFPEGVLAAHQKLHSVIPFSDDRKYFGISRPNQDGVIIYKAGAELLSEDEHADLESFIIKAGTYISITIQNYMEDIPAIGKAFEKLLSDPRIDPQGACIEWYLDNKKVQCMVRLDSSPK